MVFTILEVAPLVGAWIEILAELFNAEVEFVAPLVGAWIEIAQFINNVKQCSVAPLVGAWIEMLSITSTSILAPRRSPCGSVD